MLGKFDPQRNFFDELLFKDMLPAEHPLLDIDQAVDFSFVEAETADLYSSEAGRPSYPPEQLFRILFLEIWANLSDVQVCQQLRYNVLYRYFCRIRWGDPIPDDTTLVRFRQRLGEARVARLLERLVEQAREKGCVRGRWAVLDSTAIQAHAAARTQVEVLRESRRRLWEAVREAAPQVAEELQALAAPEPDGAHEDQARLVMAERERTQALLEALAARGADAAPRVRRVREQVERVLKDEGAASRVDPEARWGYQRKDRPFFGYKAHVVTDETGFVLAARVTAGNAADVEQAQGLLEQAQALGIRPRRVVADKAYDAAELRSALVQQGVRPYIPRRTQAQRLQRQGFTYDGRQDRWICPAGKRSLGKTPHRQGGYLIYFSEKDCRRCPLAAQCLSKSQSRKVIYWQPATDRYRPKGLKRALRVRKAIERTFGEGKQWHGMARSRYCGRARTAVQVLLTCIVIDAKKMARRLAGKDPRWRRVRDALNVAA